MADNITTSGGVVATHDDGTSHHQKMVAEILKGGAVNPVSANAGAADDGTTRVISASDDPTVTALASLLEGVTGLHQADVAALTLFNDNTGTDSSATPVTITRTGTWRARASGTTIPSVQLTRQNHDADAYDDMYSYVLDTNYREWTFNAREGDSIGAECTGSSVTLDLTLEYLGPVPVGVQSIDLSTLEASSAAASATLERVADPLKIVDVTLTIPTGAVDAGDVLAATQVVSSCFDVNDGTGTLASLAVIDPDDQKSALVFHFFSSNVTFGTENSAPSISDGDALNYLGHVELVSGDYVDVGGVSYAVAEIPRSISLKAASGTDDMYVAVSTPDGGTWAGGTITARIGVLNG